VEMSVVGHIGRASEVVGNSRPRRRIRRQGSNCVGRDEYWLRVGAVDNI